MKWKAFFINFKGLSIKQITENVFGRWDPTLKTVVDAFGISGCILLYSTKVQGKKECPKVSVVHWDVGILLEVLVW